VRFNNPKPQAQLWQLKQWVKEEMGWLSGAAPKNYNNYGDQQ